MPRLTLEALMDALPARYKDQIRAQLDPAAARAAIGRLYTVREPVAARPGAGDTVGAPAPSGAATRPGRPRRGPTKTETEFREYLARTGFPGALWEGVTFRMANGHRYTPDFIAWDAEGGLHAWEVKGAYRLGSYQRARLAFDQAAIEFPRVRFHWAERDGAGGWGPVTGGRA